MNVSVQQCSLVPRLSAHYFAVLEILGTRLCEPLVFPFSLKKKKKKGYVSVQVYLLRKYSITVYIRTKFCVREKFAIVNIECYGRLRVKV